MPNILTSEKAIIKSGTKLLGVSRDGEYGLVNHTMPSALPQDLSGSVLSGLLCSPLKSLGVEMISDPGLEGAYVGGKCPALEDGGNANIVHTQSADVHGGTKAQAVYHSSNVVNQDIYANVSVTPDLWYRCQVWRKRESGTAADMCSKIYNAAGNRQMVTSLAGPAITESSYKRDVLTFKAGHTSVQIKVGPNSAYYSGPAGVESDHIVMDDISCKNIPLTSICSLKEGSFSYGKFSSKIVKSTTSQAGMVICADSLSNPQNFILVMLNMGNIQFWKCLAGVYTYVPSANASLYLASSNPFAAYVDGARLSVIRKSGTNDFSVYYNGAHIATEIISDAEIINNTKHGALNTFEDNDVVFTYCPAKITRNVVFLGGSITNGSGASTYYTSWRQKLINHLDLKHPQVSFNFVNAADGGTDSFYTLVKLSERVLEYSPDVVFYDFGVNDAQFPPGVMGVPYIAEAVVRRIRKSFPKAKIVLCNFIRPVGSDETPSAYNEQLRAAVNEMASHYGCELYRMDVDILAAVPNATLAQIDNYFYAPGNIHPNDTGHQLIFDGLKQVDILASDEFAADVDSLSRLGETATYDRQPVIMTGADLNNAGFSVGTWSVTNGTKLSSSTAGSLIRYTGKMSIIGMEITLQNGAWPNGLQLSVDGGEFESLAVGNTGVANSEVFFSDGSVHTIEIKLVSGSVEIARLMII